MAVVGQGYAVLQAGRIHLKGIAGNCPAVALSKVQMEPALCVAESQLPVHGVFPGRMDLSHVHLPENALSTDLYSVRRASRGLRRAPRRAGSQQASSATVNNSTVVAANTAGSRALTP